MLQGIETVNNFATVNNNNRNTENAKLIMSSGSGSMVIASQDEVAQKIKKVDRSEKAAETKNQNKDRLLEFLERKVGRGEILSHDENLYVMGKKAKLYEQSMNMEKIRDRIIQRLSNKKDNETVEQIYKELTEELKKEYGMEQSSAEVNDAVAESVSFEQAEEYIRMTNALQRNFVEFAATYETEESEFEETESVELEKASYEEVELLGSGSGEKVKTDYEKKIEARLEGQTDEVVSKAVEKLNSRMFSKLNTSI